MNTPSPNPPSPLPAAGSLRRTGSPGPQWMETWSAVMLALVRATIGPDNVASLKTLAAFPCAPAVRGDTAELLRRHTG